MNRVFLIAAFLTVSFCVANGQAAEMIKIGGLQRMIDEPSEKIKVINFWATWCAPCIKELPLFEQMTEQRQDVNVNLVSVDIDLDPNPDKVHRFVARKKLKSQVFILDESDPNSWIDKIDKSWSGAIPATLVINTSNGKRKFVERELTESDLNALVDSVK